MRQINTDIAMMIRDLQAPSETGTPTLNSYEIQMNSLDYLKNKGSPHWPIPRCFDQQTVWFWWWCQSSSWLICEVASVYPRSTWVPGMWGLSWGPSTSKAITRTTFHNGPWNVTILGNRGTYMLRLDDGLETTPTGNHVAFDYVTSKTCQAISNYKALVNYPPFSHGAMPSRTKVSWTQKIECIPDDLAFRSWSKTPPQSAKGSPTSFSTMPMEFTGFNRQSKAVCEQAIHFHNIDKKILWEVFRDDGRPCVESPKAGLWHWMGLWPNHWLKFFLGAKKNVLSSSGMHPSARIGPLATPQCFDWGTTRSSWCWTGRPGKGTPEDVLQRDPRRKTWTCGTTPSSCELENRFSWTWMRPGPKSVGVVFFRWEWDRHTHEEAKTTPMLWWCPGDHHHLPVESSASGIKSNAAASAVSQPTLWTKHTNVSVLNALTTKLNKIQKIH